jgi:hypothetical protein
MARCVLFEARRALETQEFAWQYACARFSHSQLEVSYKGSRSGLWTLILTHRRTGQYTFFYVPVQLMRKRPNSTAKP